MEMKMIYFGKKNKNMAKHKNKFQMWIYNVWRMCMMEDWMGWMWLWKAGVFVYVCNRNGCL